ncbi:hypothetical protein ACFL5Z_10575 [Planctomycetota bacterium]
MCKKLFWLVCSILFVLSLVGTVSAQLPAGWQSQDIGTTGGSASEAGGTFTISGDGVDVWGASDAFHYAYVPLIGDGLITARVVDNGTGSQTWAKGGVMIRETLEANSKHMIMALTSGDGGGIAFQGRFQDTGANSSSLHGDITAAPPHWVKMTREGNTITGYHSADGVDWEEFTGGADNAGGTITNPIDVDMASDIYIGLFVTAHAAGEVRTFTFDNVTVGLPVIAYGPNPPDGAIHPDTWVNLSWSPGHTAVSHDVYFGESHADVEAGMGDTFLGNQTATFVMVGFPGFAYPEGLVPGTMYYWRIDEVEADGVTKHTGDVWNFMVPPKTAYNPDPADGAESVGPDAVTLSWTGGFGAKLHTVYFGDDFDVVNNATGGPPGGLTSYNPGTLELAKVYYWRVDEFDAMATHKGDVWSFTTPGAVGSPQPSYGAMDVGMNAILSWSPADSAASHELYFGTDKDAVRNANTGSPEYIGSKALGAESHDPGLLEPDTAYYWRVDEVDAQGNTAKGPLWIFTTGSSLVVDDFEAYTNDDVAGEAIWQTWIDGFGVADNGAQVGYLMPPYAEQTIVHGGGQSMPLLYVNEAGVTNSEASMTLAAPRDWMLVDVVELSLWFRGSSDNAAEPLYVAVSNSAGAPAVVAYDDPIAVTFSAWKKWVVSLQTIADQGITLTNVDKIQIGLGSKSGLAAAGGSGTVYIDDIRLDQAAP